MCLKAGGSKKKEKGVDSRQRKKIIGKNASSQSSPNLKARKPQEMDGGPETKTLIEAHKPCCGRGESQKKPTKTLTKGSDGEIGRGEGSGKGVVEGRCNHQIRKATCTQGGRGGATHEVGRNLLFLRLTLLCNYLISPFGTGLRKGCRLPSQGPKHHQKPSPWGNMRENGRDGMPSQERPSPRTE